VASTVRRAVAVQAVAGVLIAIVAVGLFADYRSQADRVGHQQERLLQLRDLRGELLSAETGLRGYLLVSRPAFLGPYRRAFPRIERLSAQLRKAATLDERRRQDLLSAVIEDWRQNFAQVVLRDLAGMDRAAGLRLVRTGEGKARIDRARTLLDDLSAAARTDIDAARHRLHIADLLALVGFLTATALLAVATTLLRRRLRAQVVAPVTALAAAAQAFGAGSFAARAPVSGLAELDLMARTFNEMAARVSGVVDELRQVDRMKTRLVGTVSHELRTPLTAISGYLEALLDGLGGDLNEEQQEYAQIAHENATRLEALIADLLVLSRLEGDELRLRATVDLVPLLERVVGDQRPAAAHRDVTLRLSPGPGAVVTGEDLRLTLAFGTLVGNAVKFSPPGLEVHVRVHLDQDGVVVDVVDRGVGIPEAELAQLSEGFLRASTVQGAAGNGSGIWTAREIVAAHDGRLEVESRVGEGSTFRVHLPLARPPEPAATA
jgi:signal transduction histidine kinase